MNDSQKPAMLDLRRLLGILFTFYGLLLGIYGLVTAHQPRSISFNLNLWWGVLMLIVGILFLVFSIKPPRTWDPDDDEHV
ncbi:prominin family protein [Alicyclobacillus acidiphilus]|jgi:hypothetical protein|uniref:prominin family protein n=1 Tax=Alicyclobacillus acidiphilus TaxID=182455 RepID=UPI000A60D819|nr:prominin family protein [Alicyclobacillus acidiphilus]